MMRGMLTTRPLLNWLRNGLANRKLLIWTCRLQGGKGTKMDLWLIPESRERMFAPLGREVVAPDPDG